MKNVYLRYTAQLALASFGYFALAVAGLQVVSLQNIASPVWPATGYAIGLIYFFGPRFWPAPLIGMFIADVCFGVGVLESLIISVGNTCEALLGAAIIHRFVQNSQSDPESDSEIPGIMVAALVAPLLSAAVGALTIKLGQNLTWADFASTYATWWTGNLAGALYTIPIMGLVAQLPRKLPWQSMVSALLMALATAALSWFLFYVPSGRPLAILILPWLLLTVLIARDWGVHWAAAVFGGMAIWSTAHGQGLFKSGDLRQSMISLQVFLIAVGFTALLLPSFRRIRQLKSLCALLLFGWVLSGFIFSTYFETQRARDQARFEKFIIEGKLQIERRMAIYEDALRGAAGFIKGSQLVTRQEWRDYVDYLSLLRRYPGIQGLGFIVPVSKKDRLQFVERERADGAADFSIHDVGQVDQESKLGDTDPAFVVKFIEPIETNGPALGLNIGSEKIRRQAAQQAIDQATSLITDPIELVQDQTHRSGFLFYHPLYRGDPAMMSVAERRENLIGFVYAPMTFADLLTESLQMADLPIEVTLYALDQAGSHSVVFSSIGELANTKLLESRPESSLNFIRLGHRDFPIVWHRSARFLVEQDYTLPWVGSLSTLLVLAAGWMFVYSSTFRSRAEVLVARQTQQLADREQLWRTLMESVPVAVLQTDETGRINYSNSRWADISGPELNKLVGRDWLTRIHADDQTRVRNLWKKGVESLQQFEFEAKLFRSPAEEAVVSVIVSPVTPDVPGSSFVVVVLDVTDRRRQEELLATERARLVEASRMAALGEMAGGIAHEINSPLMAIGARAEQINRLIKRGDDPASIEDAANRIEDTVQRIARIIRGLRSFSRNLDEEPKSIVLASRVIQDTLDLCRERFSAHNIWLEVECPEDLQVKCSSVQISQVLLNLLNNSFDAVEKSDSPWTRLKVRDLGKMVEFSVIDSGQGISPAVEEKLMTPFFTTKEVGRGTGLGLSISKGIVEAHGGRLWFDKSSANTCFRFEIPKA